MIKFETEVWIKNSPQNKAIIKLLKENGFRIFKVSCLTREISTIKDEQDVPKGERLICLYNGTESLEDMGINRKKLRERAERVIDRSSRS